MIATDRRRISGLVPTRNLVGRRTVLIGSYLLTATVYSSMATAAPLSGVSDMPLPPAPPLTLSRVDDQQFLDKAKQPENATLTTASTGAPFPAEFGVPYRSQPLTAAIPQEQTATLAPIRTSSRQADDLEIVGSSHAGEGQANRPVSYRPLSSTDPDADPNKLLALFQDGAGQAQTSMDELDLVIGRQQVFTDLRTLETRLNNSRRPTFNVVDRRSTQSDNLTINEIEVSQDLFWSEGRDNIRLALQKTDYTQPSVTGVNEYTGGFTSNLRLSDIVGVSGELWLNRIDYGKQRNTFATYDAYVTLRPVDTVRIDIDTSRRTFDNITSLRLGITARSYGGSVDYLPTDELRLTVRAFVGLYSDQNRRSSEEVEAIWRFRSNPVIEIGFRGTNFEFSRLLNNGYFNPKSYYSGEAMARVQTELSSKFTVELAGSGGAEDAHPGGVKPLIKGSLQAVYKLSNGWSVDGEASHFSSRDSSSSGFARTSFTLGLHYRF